MFDGKIEAFCIYNVRLPRPLKWWEKLLCRIGLRRFVKEELLEIARAMARL